MTKPAEWRVFLWEIYLKYFAIFLPADSHINFLRSQDSFISKNTISKRVFKCFLILADCSEFADVEF